MPDEKGEEKGFVIKDKRVFSQEEQELNKEDKDRKSVV